MRANIYGIGGLSLAAILSTTALGQAQPARPWVDPPPEAGSISQGSSSTSPNSAAKPLVPSSPAQAVKNVEEEQKDRSGQTKAAAASQEEKPASKSTPRKATSDSKARQPSRAVTARADRSRQTSQRRELAGSISRSPRAERIREGVNSGLEVMTLRTIEFPDGRRMQILTRPEPGVVSGLMGAPE